MRRDVRVLAHHPGVALAAELRDLPALQPFDDTAAIIAGAATGSAGDTAAALDPADPAVVYARAGGAIGKLALATRTWAWHRDAGCRAIAVARGIVACAADAVTGLAADDGTPRWTAPIAATRLRAAGDLVVAFAGARATILAAADGRVLGTLASDDGGPVVAVPVAPPGRAPTTLVLVAERGRLVALVPAAAMVPLWSLAIDGTARAIAAAGDGAIVDRSRAATPTASTSTVRSRRCPRSASRGTATPTCSPRAVRVGRCRRARCRRSHRRRRRASRPRPARPSRRRRRTRRCRRCRCRGRRRRRWRRAGS